MTTAAQHGFGITSKSLPMCAVFKKNRTAFAQEVKKQYKNLPSDFANWIGGTEKHLVICWVCGFKPRGDDARPDRGLPVFTRMLAGDTHDLLTVVYGPAPPDTWNKLNLNPTNLGESNGLWESIFEVSDALLVDSGTDNVTRHGFLKNHWEMPTQDGIVESIIVQPIVDSPGEQDVDTVLHSLLAYTPENQIFEGMCNDNWKVRAGIRQSALLAAGQHYVFRNLDTTILRHFRRDRSALYLPLNCRWK